MKSFSQKGLAFAFTAVAVVLALSSVAFACTVFKGKMTVQGSGGTGTTSAIGNNSGMGYCNNAAAANTGNGAEVPNAAPGGTITVTVAPATICKDMLGLGTNKLPSGTTYEITWLAGRGVPQGGSVDCMVPNGDNGNHINGSDMTVSSAGNGSDTSDTFTPSVGENSVCVGKHGSSSGMQVPFFGI